MRLFACVAHSAACTILTGSVSISEQGGTFHSKKSIENTWQIWPGLQNFALNIFLRGVSLNTAVFSKC